MKPTNKDIPGFLDLVRGLVASKSDETFASWYDDNGKLAEERTFGEIWETAGVIAYYLREKWGIQKGQRVILCYDFGLHFFEAFFGCLRAGATACLVYPAGPPLKVSLKKLAKVVADCKPALILTDTRISRGKALDKSNPVSKSKHLWPKNIQYVVTDKLSKKGVQSFDEPGITNKDLAFLQYTSGSTGDPKGVMITYGALAANVGLIHDGIHREMADVAERLTGFSWLPQYHDLGLIYATIAPFAGGWRMHMMSPISFIKNPLLWVKLMSEHKVHMGVGPDFAFNLVVRKFKEALQANGGKNPLPGLDLSSIHYLQNGTEPIRHTTRDVFFETFGSYGLRENWFRAGYGLAENVVGCCWVDGYYLSSRSSDYSAFVAVGCRQTFHSSLEMKVVDPQTCRECKDGETGELWIGGPSVAAGYFGKPELSKETFEGRLVINPDATYLRTGDLAFFEDDRLYICGRIKDLIIVNGVNYYPHDLEHAAQEASPAVRPGCVAAFGAGDIEQGSAAVVVFEIRTSHKGDAKLVCEQIRHSVMESAGLPISQVVAVEERSILKTTSGKIQRRGNREALHRGVLKIVYSSESCGTWDQEQEDRAEDLAKKQTESDEAQVQGDFATILASILGRGYNENRTWEELGLSSMAAVELQSQLASRLLVTLPQGFQDNYPTPKALEAFIVDHKRRPLQVYLPDIPEYGSNMTRLVQSLLQGIGMVLLLLCFALSFVPAYNFSIFLASTSTVVASATLPFVPVVWFLTLSLLVVLAKWIIIGRYKAQKIAVPSFSFVRWWFLDRLVHMWEIWVGSLVKDTPMIWLFYTALGAQVNPTANINAFIREFDLVEVGASSRATADITCRRFSSWDAEGGLTLRFRPTKIGDHCRLQGLAGLGSTIGDGSHIDRLSAVPEGATVPKNTHVLGSPGYNNGQCRESAAREGGSANADAYFLGALKLLWLILELYLFFGFLFCGESLLVRIGFNDHDFRYGTALRVALLLFITSVLTALTCVVFKWVLIGRKRPGLVSGTLYSTFADWAVDYHFRLSRSYLDTFLIAENTKLINLYLKLMGMDLDLASKLWAGDFPPSVVDLVRVQRTFCSVLIVDPESDGQQSLIELEDSSLGHGVMLSGGANVKGSQVAPFVRIDGQTPAIKHPQKVGPENVNLTAEASTVLFVGVLFWSVVPALEISRLEFGMPLLRVEVVKLATIFLVQTLTWLLLVCVFQHLLLRRATQEERIAHGQNWVARSGFVYGIYLTVLYHHVWRWSFLSLGFGTPAMNAFLAAMGAKIEGEMMCFSTSAYDFPLFTIKKHTILDRCTTFCHAMSHNWLRFGPVTAAGTLHEGTIVLCDTDMTGTAEFGPCRAFPQNAHVQTAMSIESGKKGLGGNDATAELSLSLDFDEIEV